MVARAGFVLGDYDAVIAELGGLGFAGVPERAVPKRRAEFLAGRFAAQMALQKLGVDAALGRDEDGVPIWPSGVCGSITHGARLALCAVARGSALRSIGIDAEGLLSESTKEELMARICRTDERRLMASRLAWPEHHLVTLAFSAKESLYKCLHPLVGRFMDFTAASVVDAAVVASADGIAGRLQLELSVDWSNELCRGRTLEAPFFVSERHVETAVLLPA
jgi:4'-phosphopantetheinyl transferase EntD